MEILRRLLGGSKQADSIFLVETIERLRYQVLRKNLLLDPPPSRLVWYTILNRRDCSRGAISQEGMGLSGGRDFRFPYDELRSSALTRVFACADSTLVKRGAFRANLGVAIEFIDYPAFRREYFKRVNALRIDGLLPYYRQVVKTQHINLTAPGYAIGNIIDNLAGNLLDSKYISTIVVTNTTFSRDVILPWDATHPISAVHYIEHHLHQYYPVIPAWVYYTSRRGGSAATFLLDGIQGRITKAWFEVGKRAENVYIIPRGDETHPCLSMCDLMCTYVNRHVGIVTDSNIHKFLTRNTTDINVVSRSIWDERHYDFLVPRYTHTVKPSANYLHPMFFMNSSIKSDVVKESDLYSLIQSVAESQAGCAFFGNIEAEMRSLVQGDTVICLDDEAHSRAKGYLGLSPFRDIRILRTDEFLDEYFTS